MKSDINGCSTCPRGAEQYETFYSNAVHAWRIQYEYRTPEGELFTCVAPTLTECRRRRDEWLGK